MPAPDVATVGSIEIGLRHDRLVPADEPLAAPLGLTEVHAAVHDVLGGRVLQTDRVRDLVERPSLDPQGEHTTNEWASSFGTKTRSRRA